jgi:glycosyltransferase involved in cell wall biosynthesis
MIFERAFSLPKKIALRTMYRFYGTHDRIVCQTEQMRMSLNWHTGGRFSSQTETIGNPICLAEISDSQHHPVGLVLPISTLTLVWCGRFHSIKRPDLAIETLEILRQDEGLAPHLLMLGEGALFAQAKEQVIRRSLEGICILAGYHRSPAAVFAAVTGGIGLLTSEMEGFPNVVLEMLASGIDRVVATPCCAGLADVPGVTISNSSEPQDIAAAIRLSLATAVDRTSIDGHLATRDVTQYARRIFLHSTSQV